MCIQTLFSCPAHSTSLIMALLHLCLCPKFADIFSRNFTFDSHRDLKLSRIQENVKFKYFSRSMDSFQGVFKTNFVFKDFSRLPFIFKYFSSLGEPCSKVMLCIKKHDERMPEAICPFNFFEVGCITNNILTM